jgi:hypothetical protein
VAAGYALYSSATMLVLSLGNGTHGFTLDRRTGEYMLTHPDITIPNRGLPPCVLSRCAVHVLPNSHSPSFRHNLKYNSSQFN